MRSSGIGVRFDPDGRSKPFAEIALTCEEPDEAGLLAGEDDLEPTVNAMRGRRGGDDSDEEGERSRRCMISRVIDSVVPTRQWHLSVVYTHDKRQ